MCCFETLPQTGQWTSLKKLVWHHAIIYPIELAINKIEKYTGNDYAYHISFSFHDSCKPHNLHKFHLKALPYIFNIVSLL